MPMYTVIYMPSYGLAIAQLRLLPSAVVTVFCFVFIAEEALSFMGQGNEFREEDEGMFSPASSSSGSCSYSSDNTDDEISSPAASPPETGGPLFGLSSLTTHLPAKRGLSNYFSGKSQSFSSLASVRSVEDLAKREIPFRRKMKPSMSYGGVADLSRKAISKKNSRRSCASLAAGRNNSGPFCVPKPPLIPLQKNM